MSAENRRQPRHLVDCIVRLDPLDASAAAAADGGGRLCIAQDVSATGVRIWSDRPYPANARIALTFDCAKVGILEPATCVVSVAWADPEPIENRWQLGVRFDEDPESLRIADALAHGCLWCENLSPEIAEIPASD